MKKQMTIQAYDPQWAQQFQDEKQALTSVFKDLVVTIQHVGSTAILTTKAKPEIDILIIVKEDKNLSVYDEDMIRLGYRPRGECLDQGGTPGRYYYSKDQHFQRTHKVHICKEGHKSIEEMLLFCQYLNAHPVYGKRYASLKESLCRAHGYEDIQAYLAGKAAFIAQVIEIARE